MNKIFGFLLVVAGCLFTASFNDDNANYVAPSTLKILKAKTYFKADLDTTVVVTSTPITEATTEATWLKAEIKGDSVQLSTQSNDKLTSRGAQVLLKDAKGASFTLSVTQEGSVFSLENNSDLVLEDEAASSKFKFNTNRKVTINTTADWLQTKTDADSLTISVAKNTTGKPRVGYVKLALGGFKDSIRVVQTSIDDLVGHYTLKYETVTIDKKIESKELEVEITKVTKDSISLHFGNAYSWGGKYKGGGIFAFKAGETVLKPQNTSANSNYLKSVLISNKGEMTFKKTDSINLELTNDNKLKFISNGSSHIGETPHFGFALFNKEDADQTNFLGLYGSYLDPYMIAK